MQGHIHRRVTRTRSGKDKIAWYVVVELGRTPAGRRQQKWHGGFRTRKEAEAERAKIVNDLNSGTYVRPHSITFGEYITEQWLPSMRSQLKPSTFNSYQCNLELHVLPSLGSRKLRDITPQLLNELYSKMLATGNNRGGGLSPKTVRYVHTTIHKALHDAVDLQLLATNPAERAKPPRVRGVATTELRFWTPEQLAMFLDLIRNERLYAAFHLAAMTGMRRAEICGLRWGDIDWESKSISVRHTLLSVSYKLEQSTPKSHRARVVNLDEATVDVLSDHQDQQKANKELWGTNYSDKGYVFARENGEPTHPDILTQKFDRLVAKSGLPRIRLHDLRHTHATIGLRAGIPVKVMSERLGHESPAFTLKQYAHVIPGMQAEAAQQIASLISRSSSPG